MKISLRSRLASVLLCLGVLTAGNLAVPAAEPPQPGAPAPDFTLNTLDARAVTLSAETAGQPVVLVVLRGWPGYQCPFCTKQVQDFVQKAKAFAGQARVIMVYPGPAENLKAHAEQFLKDQQWPRDFLFLTDPDFAFTQAYGLRWDAPAETAYPSTFVIDGKRVVKFAMTSKSHGGRATATEVLTALGTIK